MAVLSSPLLSAKSLSEESWSDFEALFGAYHGVRGGCWCTYYLCWSTQFDRMSREERRDYHRSLVLEGKTAGVLVYEDGAPVGWCQFAPAEALQRYDRSRAYRQLELTDGEKPRWRISCLFTDKHRRSRGIARFALHAALEEIASRGGGIVEAFPFDIPGMGHNQHTGSVDMYLREGFEAVCRLGKNDVLMRRNVLP